MLSYELARELKDAGFSQGGFIGARYYNLVGHPGAGIPVQWAVTTQISEGRMFEEDGGYTRIPTLPELIEACGESFSELHYNSEGANADLKWLASGFILSDIFPQGIDCLKHGSTPEIAVARLWLALNKK